MTAATAARYDPGRRRRASAIGTRNRRTNPTVAMAVGLARCVTSSMYAVRSAEPLCDPEPMFAAPLRRSLMLKRDVASSANTATRNVAPTTAVIEHARRQPTPTATASAARTSPAAADENFV